MRIMYKIIFNDADKTMTNVFDRGIKCIVSWKSETLFIMSGERVVDAFPFGERTIGDLLRLLNKIAKTSKCRLGIARVNKLKKLRYTL